MDPVAGSRRRWIVAGGALVLGACVGAGPPAPQRQTGGVPLVPAFGLQGARILLKTGGGGTPAPSAFGPYQGFVFPVAIAATGLDIYVADAALGRIFRYDRGYAAMSVMPVPASPATRLQAASDGSLYVLDTIGSGIHRYGRDGQALPVMHPLSPTSRYLDFAIDPVSGRAFALDANHARIDRIEPLGRIAIPEAESVAGAAIAADSRSIFVADARCACVNEYREGRILRQWATGEIRQPRALAVERDRLYQLDAFDRSIAVVHPGGVERMSAPALGLVAPEAIAAYGGQLYVADGAGHSIAVFQRSGGRP